MRSQINSTQSGTVLLITLTIVFMVSVVVFASINGANHRENMTRNLQFRIAAVTAASSEMGAHIHQVNKNPSDDDDEVVIDLLGTVGDDREFELDLGSTDHPLLTDVPHAQLSGVRIDGNMTTHTACPGSSIGAVNVMMGTIHAQADLGDSGIRSSQQQHFIYCWP